MVQGQAISRWEESPIIKDMEGIYRLFNPVCVCPQWIKGARARRWLLGLWFVLAGIVCAAPALAGDVLPLTWYAPTTKAGGAALTDLARYRVYFGFSDPPCPGVTFIDVPSATTTPSAGESVTFKLTGLVNASTEYFVQVTAIDSRGNESGCSNERSGSMENDISASLTIRTVEGVEVFLGGNYGYMGISQGLVPAEGELAITDLAPGTQVVRTRLAGFLDGYSMIELFSGTNLVPDLDLALFDPTASVARNLVPLEAGTPIQGGGGASVPFVVD